MQKIYDEFNYYGAKIQIDKDVRVSIPTQRLSKITQEISSFE